jgi:hypothetical protein
MSVIEIRSKADLSRMARWLDSRKDVKYHTRAGEYGYIVLVLDNAVYPG